MTDQKLRRLQAGSGVLFSVFLAVHLFNQAVAVRGAAAYDAVQGSLRAVYQAPTWELALVFAPLLAHVAFGVTTAWRRRGEVSRPVAWPARLHRWSGRFLAVVVGGHVGATRGLALLGGPAPHFAGVAFTFQWVPAWFWPYYTLLALAGWYHLVFGLGLASAQLGLRGGAVLSSRRVLVPVFLLGALALLGGVLAFGTAGASALESGYARWWTGRG